MNLGKAGGALENEDLGLGVLSDSAELAVELGAAVRVGAGAVF